MMYMCLLESVPLHEGATGPSRTPSCFRSLQQVLSSPGLCLLHLMSRLVIDPALYAVEETICPSLQSSPHTARIDFQRFQHTVLLAVSSSYRTMVT